MAGWFDLSGLDEVSGGSIADAGGGLPGGTAEGDTSAPEIEQFITDEGQPLARPLGEHLIGGQLIMHKFVEGPPPSLTVIIAGGDGTGNEWESVEKVWYSGNEIAESPDGIEPGWRFHPGQISSGVADPDQGVPDFHSNGLAYSGTAYIEILLPEQYSIEDAANKIRWRAKTAKVWDYDFNGNPLNFAYSVNPADHAVHVIKRYYDTRFRDDDAEAAARFQRRVDWLSYTDFWNMCAENITWNDGDNPTRQIARFQSHPVFTSPSVTLADALDVICGLAATFWQDDGKQISFKTPFDTEIAHHFNESNIVSGSVSVVPSDMRSRPNYLIAEYRSLDDPFLQPTKTPPIFDETLIRRVGRIASTRQFPNMLQSQAQRLLHRQLRLESLNPRVFNLRGLGDSFHVLQGDYVTVTHPIPDWQFQRCLVLAVDVDSGERTADECAFVVQAINGDLYSDSDHGPVQAAVEP